MDEFYWTMMAILGGIFLLAVVALFVYAIKKKKKVVFDFDLFQTIIIAREDGRGETRRFRVRVGERSMPEAPSRMLPYGAFGEYQVAFECAFDREDMDETVRFLMGFSAGNRAIVRFEDTVLRGHIRDFQIRNDDIEWLSRQQKWVFAEFVLLCPVPDVEMSTFYDSELDDLMIRLPDGETADG